MCLRAGRCYTRLPLSIHDQPTQLLHTLPPDETLWREQPEAPRRRATLLGFVGRLLLVLLAVVLALVAAALLVTPPRESVLVLGTDARPDELRRGAVGRTDTLMLMVADRATPKVALVSVPRDLWVPVPGYGEERINAAFELGGSQTAKQTVSNVLGQPVDRYLLVGLQGVRDIVDAVGGVDITVDQPIHDDAYPTDDYGIVTVDIPAGRQHMDGETALRYARTRHQDSDFGRIARQQRVVSAVRAKMMNPLNWPRLPALVAAVQQSVKTDLSPLDATAVGAALLRQPGDPDRLVVDTTLVQPVTGQDGAYLLSPRPELQRTVAKFLGASQAIVEVLNGTGVAGMARTTADKLARQGLQVAAVGDADRQQAQTAILVRPESRRTGEQAAGVLGVPASRISESSLPAGIDVRVVVGADLAGR